ncbi:MAG: DUF3426 domain-containing protein [Pseudomonadota bacterium]
MPQTEAGTATDTFSGKQTAASSAEEPRIKREEPETATHPAEDGDMAGEEGSTATALSDNLLSEKSGNRPGTGDSDDNRGVARETAPKKSETNAEPGREPREPKSKTAPPNKSPESAAPETDGNLSQIEEPPSPRTSEPPLQKASTTGEEDDFENSLFSLFDEDADDGGDARAKFALATSEPPSGKQADRTERREDSSPPVNRHSAAEDNWDLFSDENIEAVQGPYSEQREEAPASPAEAPPKEQSPSEPRQPSPAEEAAGDGETADHPSAGSAVEELKQPTGPLDKEASGDEGEESVTGPQPAAEEKAILDSYTLPPQFQQRQGRPILRGILWGGGILLLLLTLVFQYYFFHQRDTLADNAKLRPLLSRICELSGCTLPPRRDLTRIELADHLMQSHPRHENSLLITAILVNRAEFNQPFPIVEVIMTDLQQKVVARRRFRPEQYLIGDARDREFIPNTEIPLMLEVVDPGENAVGFEFNFY